MRKFTTSLLSLVLVAILAAPTLAQSPPAANHQVGLIDMAHVFKNYDKFTALTEALQEDIVASGAEMQAKAEAGKKIQEQMKAFEVGSPEFEKLEGDLLSIQTEIQKLQLVKRREFMRREAYLYRDIYHEVSDAVERYARYYKYTLILRFDRTGVTSADNPQEIAEGLNQQVLYHRKSDDLTDPILNYLNNAWKKSSQEMKAPGSSSVQ